MTTGTIGVVAVLLIGVDTVDGQPRRFVLVSKRVARESGLLTRDLAAGLLRLDAEGGTAAGDGRLVNSSVGLLFLITDKAHLPGALVVLHADEASTYGSGGLMVQETERVTLRAEVRA